MTDLPLGPCQSYHPGHQTHPTQSFRSQQDPDWPGVPCTVVDYWENGVIVLDVGRDQHRYWTHHPIRVWQLVSRNGGRCVLQEGRRLLRTKSEDGWYCFSLGDADGWAEQRCVLRDEDDRLHRVRAG